MPTARRGGRVLQRAFDAHDTNLDAYRRTAGAFLRQLDPHSDTNVRRYTDALVQLYAK